MRKIAIFASGSGSNAENIIRHFNDKECAEVVLVLSNKADSLVLNRAHKYSIPTCVFTWDEFANGEKVKSILKEYNASMIILAGFLLKIPEMLVKSYPGAIVNIHPALLPKYGGKGMYGMHVHRVVVENQEKESGITIHYVNEYYDEGEFIFQAKCPILSSDSPEEVQRKVQELEAIHFPIIIESIL
jgi:phosphoribosylglycinamide formyltransferase-1